MVLRGGCVSIPVSSLSIDEQWTFNMTIELQGLRVFWWTLRGGWIFFHIILQQNTHLNSRHLPLSKKYYFCCGQRVDRKTVENMKIPKLGTFIHCPWSLREDTHKKSVVFSVRTTKGVTMQQNGVRMGTWNIKYGDIQSRYFYFFIFYLLFLILYLFFKNFNLFWLLFHIKWIFPVDIKLNIFQSR